MSYRVRTNAACLIVHGSIGECVVASKDGILDLRTARLVRAIFAYCGDGLFRGATVLTALRR